MKNDRLILIPIPALFSFEECTWFLNRNYDDCLHVISGNTVTKAVEFNGELFLIRINQNGSFLELEILVGDLTLDSKAFLEKFVLEWFDMDRSIQPFYDLVQQDGRLAYMVEEFKGLRLIGIADLFETICWCIIGQQINLTFAYKVKRRLIEKYGKKVDYEGETYYIFPESETLANAVVEDLRAMQFSQQKIETFRKFFLLYFKDKYYLKCFF